MCYLSVFWVNSRYCNLFIASLYLTMNLHTHDYLAHSVNEVVIILDIIFHFTR
jgi:hypothetical protein